MIIQSVKRSQIVIVNFVFLITYFVILISSAQAFCRLTNTPNMNAIFGKFAICRDIYSNSKYHVIYDEEVLIDGNSYYKLMYQYVDLINLIFISDPIVIQDIDWGCRMPLTPSVVMGEDGWLHVLAVRYPYTGPMCEHSELHYFAMQPETGFINPLTRHKIHLERHGEGRPNSSEHIFGTDIAYVHPHTIYAVWDQHDEIREGPDPDDHDVMFNKSTDGGYTWLTDPNGNSAPIVVSNPGARADDYEELKPSILVDNQENKIWVVFQRKVRGGSPASDVKYCSSTDGGDTWSRALRVSPPGTTAASYMCPSIQQDQTGQLYVSCIRHGTDPHFEQIKIYKYYTEPWPIWLEADYSPIAVDASPDSPTLYPYYGCYPSFKIWGVDEFSIIYEKHGYNLENPDSVVYVGRYNSPSGYKTVGPRFIYFGGFTYNNTVRWVAHFDNPKSLESRQLDVFWSLRQQGITKGDIVFDRIPYQIRPSLLSIEEEQETEGAKK